MDISFSSLTHGTKENIYFYSFLEMNLNLYVIHVDEYHSTFVLYIIHLQFTHMIVNTIKILLILKKRKNIPKMQLENNK